MSRCKQCGVISYALVKGVCGNCRRYAAKDDFNRGRLVAFCNLCDKEIYDRNGTFLAGVGSVHIACGSAKVKLDGLK